MAYHILSLDGGGSWAILQAMALAKIYPGKSPAEILNKFDLVAANSGGSMMLAAMLTKNSMQEVMENFLDEKTRKDVFSKLKKGERDLIEKIAKVLGYGPRYRAPRKLEGLRKALGATGDKPLSGLTQALGLRPQLLITTFDYDLQRAVYLRSDPAASGGNVYEETLAEAVHAASNAPINYFDDPATFRYQSNERRFWDGAVGGNNNPALVAVMEAMGVYGIPATDIQVLSIGTANVILPVKELTPYPAQDEVLVQPRGKVSLPNDILKMATCILQEPTDAASYMAHVTLGGRAAAGSLARIIRLNALIQPRLENDHWVLPQNIDAPLFAQMATVDMDAVTEEDMKVVVSVGQAWLSGWLKNQPVRASRETLACEIGHATFAEGADAWLQLNP